VSRAESRGDRTAIELFLEGLNADASSLRWFV